MDSLVLISNGQIAKQGDFQKFSQNIEEYLQNLNNVSISENILDNNNDFNYKKEKIIKNQ